MCAEADLLAIIGNLIGNLNHIVGAIGGAKFSGEAITLDTLAPWLKKREEQGDDDGDGEIQPLSPAERAILRETVKRKR